LTAAGVISVSQVRKPAHVFFACIPLLFGLQQCCEGFVWLSLSDAALATWNTPAKYAFLIFAQTVWPIWIPLAFLLIEPSLRRRRILRYFLAAGAGASLLLTYQLLFLPANTYITGCHIEYDLGASGIQELIRGLLYIAAIVVGPFFSSWKKAILLAVANVASLVVTEFFFRFYLVSVWCFFAAAQSVLVILVMREIRRAQVETPPAT
jgi:hypothetical protein